MLQSLHTAMTGLKASQFGIDVTSHNISNSENENYTKQIVEQSSLFPRNIPSGDLGIGVQIDNVSRIHNEALFSQIKISHSHNSDLSKYKDTLDNINNIFSDSEINDTGLNSKFDRFYDSLNRYTDNPQSSSLNIEVKESLTNVYESINNNSNTISSYITTLKEEKEDIYTKANQYMEDIDLLSKKINEHELLGNSNANDLRDKRDSLEKELSKMGYLNVQKSNLPVNNRINITDAGSHYNIIDFNDTDGELQGINKSIDFLDNLLSEFNNKITEYNNNINTIYQQNGDEELLIIGDNISNYNINPTIDKINISLDSIEGNNEIGLSILDLQEGIYNNINTLSVSIDSEYNSTQNSLGSSEIIFQQLSIKRDSISKVNLDEEMTNIIKYQRAYEANAKVIQVSDEILQTTLDLKR